MLEIRRLDEQAKRAIQQARGLIETASRENRGLTAEENRQIDAWNDEAERALQLRERLKAQEAIERRELETAETERIQREARARDRRDPEERERRYREAFQNWMRRGLGGISSEHRSLMEGGFRPLDQGEMAELAVEGRALGTAQSTPFGGYTIPQDFMARVELAMDAWNGVFRAPCEQFTTAGGAPMPWPTSDDRTSSGELLGETVAAAELDNVFGRVVFDAYTYSSKTVRVQRQLLQDEGVNLEAVLATVLGERLGRITGAHLTTGTGTAQPNGIVTAAANSNVTLSLAAGDPTYDDLADIEASVAEPYRIGPGTGWMFGDPVLAKLRKLKDSQLRPLWEPGGMALNAPPTVLGYRYYLNQLMPAMSGTNRTILFGDLSRYKIRRVLGMTMLRLEERFAEYLQVGFLAFMRLDGDIVDAGAGSIKYAAHVA